MRKFFILFIMTLTMFNCFCQETFDWSRVIDAIIYVESRGNENAVSADGTCVGPMQIKKIVVDDCNEYLSFLGVNKKYEYNDRYSTEKSKEMFILIQKRYNKSNNIEKAIRIWNGGCNYSTQKTNSYFNKVIKKYGVNE